jgi:hypothetical protein
MLAIEQEDVPFPIPQQSYLHVVPAPIFKWVPQDGAAPQLDSDDGCPYKDSWRHG